MEPRKYSLVKGLKKSAIEAGLSAFIIFSVDVQNQIPTEYKATAAAIFALIKLALNYWKNRK